MEFLYKNPINTTSSISVASGTGTVAYLFRRDLRYQYSTSGDNSDLTTSSITFSFDETTTVSRLALMEMNWKEFDIFYDGVTANTFSITSTASTITSQWSTNSETSMFIHMDSVDCTSVTFDIKTTQTADQEKALGWFLISSVLMDFDRIPASKNYKPSINPKQIVHRMSDGGTRIQTIDEKFSTKIKFKHITTAFRDSLKTVWSLRSDFVFIAFGTSTSWDGICYDVVWPGGFKFYTHSDDFSEAGFSGQIDLKEL